VTLTADAYLAGDASKAVPFSGLLASDPTLPDAELTAGDWDRLLAAYLDSPRP